MATMQFSEEICADDKRNLQICHAVGSVTCVNQGVEPWVLQRALARVSETSIEPGESDCSSPKSLDSTSTKMWNWANNLYRFYTSAHN